MMQAFSAQKAELLKRRADRLASKQEFRKAALALKERAALVGDAVSWVLAGAMLRRAHRDEEAIAALRHGMWLHERAGDVRKARAVARVIERLDPSDRAVRRYARAS
jgi:hypothetical protein